MSNFIDSAESYAMYIFLKIKDSAYNKKYGAPNEELTDNEMIGKISAALAALEYRGHIKFMES